ncbi:LacI family DNA-binding transcriptional regulator [Micromonospora musae]|uniref:LacI family DNA-binding transcriptional regulator n=1 Tax=Micromonospora musae TaxID=1894970 RepID=UPI0033DF9BDC
MAATLKDVAQLARVSVKSVSNVVNGYPHVSHDLRRRVHDAIERLGYRPNLAARHLRTGRTGLLALVVPDAPCLDELARQILHTVAARGYRTVVDHAEQAPARPGARLPVDGVLVAADVVPPELIETHLAARTPLVLLGEQRDERCDHVGIDAARAARDATEHLLETGRRRIAVIGTRPAASSTAPQPRTLGYQQALRRAGISVPDGYLRTTRHHRHPDGYQAARALFAHEHPPDAIFCFSDPLAVGAIRAAVDVGLRVPGDVAVIGMGDSSEGSFCRPTLSTVSADPAALARRAVARLTSRILRPDAAPVQVVAPHTLQARGSTAAG